MAERGKAELRRWTAGAMAALVLLATLAGAESALALDIKVTATIRPGHLTLDAATDVSSPAELRQGLHRVLITVTDARGSGDGWRLDLRATTTAARGIAVVGIDTRCGKRSTCTLPQPRAVLPAELAPGRGTTIVEGRKGTGMGRIDLTLTIATGTANGKQALSFSLRAG